MFAVASVAGSGAWGQADPGDEISAALAALEKREGGRLGVVIRDAATGASAEHRAHELFAMCSTFKFVLSAFILHRIDSGIESLERAIPVAAKDILSSSPITEKAVGRGLTIAELCRAAVTTSDNAAANLLLKACGGPGMLTTFLRSIGDEVTRLDRYEPELNNQRVAAGDLRDTTSPAAMATTMQKLLLGNVLSPASRVLATSWLRETVTGLTRLRGGFPPEWEAGDKTGTGANGPTNDIAIAWPPGRAPLFVTAFYDRGDHEMSENAAVLAEVGRIVGRFVSALPDG